MAKIHGIEEFCAGIRLVSRTVQDVIMTEIMQEAGELFVEEARKSLNRETVRRTGNLEGSIIAKVVEQTEGRVVLEVGPAKANVAPPPFDGYYGHMIEGGTKPHPIPVRSIKKRGRKKSEVQKELAAMKYRQHPGIGATRFLETAFLNASGRAMELIENRVKEALERAAAR